MAKIQDTTLPALEGTHRQVEWAVQIREQSLPRAAEAVDVLREQLARIEDEMPALVEEGIADGARQQIALLHCLLDAGHVDWALEDLRQTTRAGWWIDYRRDGGGTLLWWCLWAEHSEAREEVRESRLDQIRRRLNLRNFASVEEALRGAYRW